MHEYWKPGDNYRPINWDKWIWILLLCATLSVVGWLISISIVISKL